MIFDEIQEFRKDLKRLQKKYRSLEDDLEDDLEVLKKTLRIEPDAVPPFSFEIDGLKISTCIIKVRKIACKSLKGRGANSGLRLIYAYFRDESRIVLVELYHKSNKPGEDLDRIKKYFS